MKQLLLFLTVLLLPISALAEQPITETTAKPLSIGITKSLYLPPEMYGHWSVTGTLVNSNSDSFFNPVVHDIWVLERQGEQVVLSNPVSGASANVEVDKVEGSTATFHHMVVNKSRIMFEMPTITVLGDRLTGVSVNKFQRIRKGKVVQSAYGHYRLEAQRIGQDRLKFKPEEEAEDEIEFEIEEVLPRRPSDNPLYH